MTPSPPPDTTLPPLTFSSLVAGRRFTPLTFGVPAELVRTFSELTGDDNPLYRDPDAARAAGLDGAIVPPGLAGVWARLSYLAEHRMPPGGVMAGQRFAFAAPVAVGETLTLGAHVAEQEPDDPKRRVLLACRAVRADGAVAGEVHIDARWPAEDDR
jgi:acyl dehydratase